MAVGFDAFVSSEGSSTARTSGSFDFTIANQEKRALFVAFNAYDATNFTASFTRNGLSSSLVSNISPGGLTRIVVHKMLNPTVGTYSLAWSTSAGIKYDLVSAVAFYGVDLDDPYDIYTFYTTAPGGSHNLNMVSAVGGYCWDSLIVYGDGLSITGAARTTMKYKYFTFRDKQYLTRLAGDGNTLNFSYNHSNYWLSHFGMSLNPYIAPPVVEGRKYGPAVQ